MVSALASGSSGPILSPNWGHLHCLLKQETLLSVCFFQGV